MSVLGVRWLGLTLSVEGIGWVIREWSEEVRLGIIRECSPWSLVAGLSDCLSRVRGRTKAV